jgi:hypothetical protein
MSMQRVVSLGLLVFGVALARADELDDGFAAPPLQARLRAYWWWLNGNVTAEAITRDLEWMKQIGMGGALVFDAGGATQGGHAPVPAGPLFGSPEWRKLFKHTLTEADRVGLEIGMNLQSGWNLGGPMVTPGKSAKVVAWSQLKAMGPTNLSVALPKPESRDGFYRDSFVLAYRANADAVAVPIPALSTSSWQGAPREHVMFDGDPSTFWVSDKGPTPQSPEWVRVAFSQPVTLGGVLIRGRPEYGPRECEWQVSADGRTYTRLQGTAMEKDRPATLRFPAVTASDFRLLIRSSYDPHQPKSSRNVQITEIVPLDAGGQPLYGGGRPRPIRMLAQKSAYHELGGSASDCSSLLEDDPAAPGEEDVLAKDVIDLSDKVTGDGKLNWDVPAGQWVVLRFGYTGNGAHVSTASGAWQGLVLDYLDADALRWYWHEVIDPIIADAGPLCGKVWKMVQTDSWELNGVNWTPSFPAEFQKRRGYDIRAWLPVLAGRIVESRDASNRFLADFRRTIADCVADNHYGTMAALAREHGLGIQPESAGPHTAPLDGLLCYRWSTWPMSEFWVPSPHRPTDDKRFFVKQAASAAHIYGQPIVCAEGFTSIGPQWNDVLWKMQKPSFDHEACAGLNLVFWHAFTCSPKEMGLPGQEYFAGTHFNPQITWADQAHAFVGYLNRCQALLQRGQFVADVLYYYGDHVPNIARRKQDDPAGVLPEYDYDVINEEALLRASVRDGRVALPSGMSYRVLVLSRVRALSLVVARKIRDLAKAGAVIVGPKPERTTGRQDDGELARIAAELWDSGRIKDVTAKEALKQQGVLPDVQGIPDWIHRHDNDSDVYFVSWQNAEPGRADCTFRVSGRHPEIWDPVSGMKRDASAFTQSGGRTTVPLEFAPYGSLFVIFRKPAGASSPGRNFPGFSRVAEVTGSWQVLFDPKWSGLEAAPITFDRLASWTERPEEGVRFYSGRGVYRKVLSVQESVFSPGRRLWVDLGTVADLAEVKVNGKNLGVVWTPPFRVDITDAAKTGENELEITVVNGWWNRIIRDQALPADRRMTHTNIRLKPDAKTMPAGLLGPVEILTSE